MAYVFVWERTVTGLLPAVYDADFLKGRISRNYNIVQKTDISAEEAECELAELAKRYPRK